jgi:hypothetical protein
LRDSLIFIKRGSMQRGLLLVTTLLLSNLFTNTLYAGIQKNLFDGKTSIKDPIGLRDPFKRPITIKKRETYSKGGVYRKGRIFTNQKGIEGAPISNIRVVGILLGKERRALVRLRSGEKGTFMLREGMKLGPERAELKAILPGGIVVVEKIKNIYNQEEYLETVIPVTDQ